MNSSDPVVDRIDLALNLLDEDMAIAESFDPQKDYHEKNKYFDRANNVGLPILVRQDQYSKLWAELFYTAMAGRIQSYEQESSKIFNKGMVLANLGIAQISTGKFNQGIANLLRAEIEDKLVNPPEYDILNEILWTQFEHGSIYPYLIRIGKETSLRFEVDISFCNKFFRDLSRQDRIFLQGTILDLIVNSVFAVPPNSYTHGQILSGLRDVTVSVEALLRNRQRATEKLREGEKSQLSTLLNTALGIDLGRIKFPHDPQMFMKELERTLSGFDPDDRRIYVLALVRNFTGHHFEVTGLISPSTGENFFDTLFHKVIDQILSAVLYLKQQDKI